jgi:hypothetical protein
MSGGMGYYDGGLYDDTEDGDGEFGQGQQQVPQKRNPLRDHLKKVEDQNSELQKQLATLLKENRESKIASQLQAKGYSPAVAGLYSGEPEKLDEWLTSVGPLLAKQPDATASQGQPQGGGTGVPASTVPAEGQAAMQQLQQMGSQAAAPAGTDAEQIAQIRSMQTPEALQEYLRSQGNPHYWNG